MAAGEFDGVDEPVPAKPKLTERLKDAMLKPTVKAEMGPEESVDEGPTTVEEIQAAIDRADDKERLVGLLLAPIGAAIAFVITSALVAHDPKVGSPAHVNPHTYVEVGGSAILLAVLMMAMAWWRKRLFLGIVMALYGLTLFNLHWWGFGIPYILAGAWLLVRAYRLHEKLKLATADGGTIRNTTRRPAGPNKRYTPPTSRPSKPKPDEERKAG
jgi:hypothetical protein